MWLVVLVPHMHMQEIGGNVYTCIYFIDVSTQSQSLQGSFTQFTYL